MILRVSSLLLVMIPTEVNDDSGVGHFGKPLYTQINGLLP